MKWASWTALIRKRLKHHDSWRCHWLLPQQSVSDPSAQAVCQPLLLPCGPIQLLQRCAAQLCGRLRSGCQHKPWAERVALLLLPPPRRQLAGLAAQPFVALLPAAAAAAHAQTCSTQAAGGLALAAPATRCRSLFTPQMQAMLYAAGECNFKECGGCHCGCHCAAPAAAATRLTLDGLLGGAEAQTHVLVPPLATLAHNLLRRLVVAAPRAGKTVGIQRQRRQSAAAAKWSGGRNLATAAGSPPSQQQVPPSQTPQPCWEASGAPACPAGACVPAARLSRSAHPRCTLSCRWNALSVCRQGCSMAGAAACGRPAGAMGWKGGTQWPLSPASSATSAAPPLRRPRGPARLVSHGEPGCDVRDSGCRAKETGAGGSAC